MAAPPTATAPITDETWQGIKMAKVFRETGHHIASLEFDDSGANCFIACPEDESILLYDALEGRHKKTVYSKKYGVGPVRSTHHPNNVIYASSKLGKDN